MNNPNNNVWQINNNMAAQYTPNTSSFIDSACLDVFTIKNAVWKSDDFGKGVTKQLMLFIENSSGKTTTAYLIYQFEGTPNEQGENSIHALGVLTNNTQLSAAPGTYEGYDKATRSKVMRDALICPELINRKVGMVLFKRAYLNSANEEKFTMTMYQMFDANTKQTADEKQRQQPGSDQNLQVLLTQALEKEQYFASQLEIKKKAVMGNGNGNGNGYSNGYNNGFNNYNNNQGFNNNGYNNQPQNTYASNNTAQHGYGNNAGNNQNQPQNGYYNAPQINQQGGQVNQPQNGSMQNGIPKAAPIDDDIPF